jgi:predicted aspartyl protease
MTSRRPVVKLIIETLVSRSNEVVEAPIDTGFAGFLMTPAELYRSLSELEVPEENFRTYSTIFGPLWMRRAKVRL